MAIDVTMHDHPRRISCESTITRVAVHARGALITREVTLPDEVPAGEALIKIPGISPAANANSARVGLHGSARRLISLVSEFEIPLEDRGEGVSAARVRELEARMRRLELERSELGDKKHAWANLLIAPQRASEWRDDGPIARVERALALAKVVNEHVATLDARLTAIDREIAEIEQEQRRARLANAMTSSTERDGESRPEWAFTALVDGEGPIERLELSYVVEQARWWPLYTLHLRDGGRAARLIMEAVVAQRSGEDWTRAALSLSTADLIQDARLPELPALKLGKVQPPKRSGYREPPEGLERLFSGYDKAKGPLDEAAEGGRTAARNSPAPAKPLNMRPPGAMPAPTSTIDALSLDDDEGDFEESKPMPPMQAMQQEMSRAQVSPSAPMFPEVMAKKSRGGFLPSFDLGFGGGGGPPAASAPMRERSQLTSRHAPPEPEPALEPEDAWLDFDKLEMPGPGEHARGRLRKRHDHTHSQHDDLSAAVFEADRLGAGDPLYTRGSYDHRFDTEGFVDIPSDAHLHRVEVTSATGPARLWWRTVPLERDEVFRMARVLNPMEAPLLTGPLDVFVEGSFLLSTSLAHVDRGGDIIVGLGVDDRIKVARNVRVEEESLGLLGGKTAVSHTVTIDVTSHLPFPAKVEVIDRVPITHQDHLEIDEIHTEPRAKVYTQKREGDVIKGGRRWKVDLEPGEAREFELSFRLVFSSKEEIVGGNRRD